MIARHPTAAPTLAYAALTALLLGAVLGTATSAHAEDHEIDPITHEISPIEHRIEPLAETETVDGAQQITLDTDILFDTGSAELSDAARAKIAELVADVPQGAEVTVDGHTDNVPFSGEGGNQKLSEDRAQAVADAIVAARSDLKPSATGYGESKPVGDNDKPEGRAENRRVEIRYHG